MVMKNVILAGVGGHGVITLTNLLSQAILEQGLNIKQTEVLGFAQREGSVYAHVRYSERDISSCSIPLGEVDLIIGTEPGEACRYIKYLKSEGIIVTNSHSFPEDVSKMYDYSSVLNTISHYSNHLMVDASEICYQAGSSNKSSNIVMLGAAFPYLGLKEDSFQKAICSWLKKEKEAVLEANLRAFELGKRFALVESILS